MEVIAGSCFVVSVGLFCWLCFDMRRMGISCKHVSYRYPRQHLHMTMQRIYKQHKKALWHIVHTSQYQRLMRIDLLRYCMSMLSQFGPFSLREYSSDEQFVWYIERILMVGGLSGSFFGSWIAGFGGALLFVLWIVLRIHKAEQEHQRAIQQSLPDVYKTLALSLGSGQTVAQAFEYLAAQERMASRPMFVKASLRLSCGVPLEQVIRALGDDLCLSGSNLMATALIIAHRTGSPLEQLLVRSALLAERRYASSRLLHIKTAQVRFSVKVVCMLPVVLVLLLAVISPDFQSGITTVSGIGSLSVAALLNVAALLSIRRMMQVVDV